MTHFSIAYVFAALCFFLYGLHMTEEGFRQAVGDQLRAKIGRLTRHRLAGFFLGIIMAIVFQSSTATTVMMVGLASIGLLNVRQAAAVVLGADVGTTLLVVLLASIVRFDATILSFSILVSGFVATFLLRQGRRQFFAEALLGFGFIFYGLTLMGTSATPLRESPLSHEVIAAIAGNHAAALFLAALFTGLVQSSAAIVGILLSFAAAGLLTATDAVPFVLGANLGGTVGPLLAGFRAQTEGKRLALLHVMTKSLVIFALLPFADVIGEWATEQISVPSYQVAAIHIFFNVILAVVFLPIVPLLSRWMSTLVRPRVGESEFGPKYLDEHALESPTLAFANVTREILRMAEITQEMCALALAPFEEQDRETMNRLEEMDDQVDRLDKGIKFYLAKVAQTKLTDEQAQRELELLMLTHDLESVGDVVSKDLMALAEKRRRKGVSFSTVGREEIHEFHRQVMENFQLAVTSFATGNIEIGQKVMRHKKQIAQLEQELSQKHLFRLHQGYKESIETSSIHLDILSNLRRINSIICKMAYPVLDRRGAHS